MGLHSSTHPQLRHSICATRKSSELTLRMLISPRILDTCFLDIVSEDNSTSSATNTKERLNLNFASITKIEILIILIH